MTRDGETHAEIARRLGTWDDPSPPPPPTDSTFPPHQHSWVPTGLHGDIELYIEVTPPSPPIPVTAPAVALACSCGIVRWFPVEQPRER